MASRSILALAVVFAVSGCEESSGEGGLLADSESYCGEYIGYLTQEALRPGLTLVDEKSRIEADFRLEGERQFVTACFYGEVRHAAFNASIIGRQCVYDEPIMVEGDLFDITFVFPIAGLEHRFPVLGEFMHQGSRVQLRSSDIGTTMLYRTKLDCATSDTH